MSVSLLIINGSSTLEIPIKCRAELITVGSHPKNVIVVNGDLLSRWHCFLYRRMNRWYIQDGDFNAITGDASQWSLHGTFLNGNSIKELYDQFMLVSNDLVTFGTPDPESIPRICFKGFVVENKEYFMDGL